MPEKIDLNLCPFTSVSLFRIIPLFSSQLLNANHVSSPSHDLDTLQLKLIRCNHIKSGRLRIGLHLFDTTKNRQMYRELNGE